MKEIALLLLVTVLVTAGCENKRLEFDPMINVDKVYEINQTGEFSEFQTITHDEILDLLDISEDATIESVKIESVSIYFEVLQGNQAESVTMSGVLEESGVGDVLLFEDETFSLSTADITVINSLLVAGGTEKIRQKLEKYLQMNDNNPFNLVLVGDSNPGGQTIHVSVQLRIKGAVKYVVCESLPCFIEADGYCD